MTWMIAHLSKEGAENVTKVACSYGIVRLEFDGGFFNIMGNDYEHFGIQGVLLIGGDTYDDGAPVLMYSPKLPLDKILKGEQPWGHAPQSQRRGEDKPERGQALGSKKGSESGLS